MHKKADEYQFTRELMIIPGTNNGFTSEYILITITRFCYLVL